MLNTYALGTWCSHLRDVSFQSMGFKKSLLAVVQVQTKSHTRLHLGK